MSKFLGASQSFNAQWTLIIRNDQEDGYLFMCGCGHESEYRGRQFIDPHTAAVTAMEFHRCEG